MTVLLDQTLASTLDALVERLGRLARGTAVEAWTFDDAAARRTAEMRLARAGIAASLRSACKPLVHALLDEMGAAPGTVVKLPCHPAATDARWRLEAYPAAALMPDIAFAPGELELHYTVCRDGVETRVFAPNVLRADHLGAGSLIPCGWLRVRAPDGAVIEDRRIETALEQVFAAVMGAVAAHAWPAEPPFFNTLLIEATVPGIERALAYGDEVISTTEALHEDLYFSILEWFKQRAGLGPGDRTLKPGCILPDIRLGGGAAHVRLTVLDAPPSITLLPGPDSLEEADRPLAPEQIEAMLAELGGAGFCFPSVHGRNVGGTIVAGPHSAVVITAGQHANETASVVGGLRAMRRLVEAGLGGVGFVPMENPDGHALHHTLRAQNPRHMAHAARYTALGSDLEFTAGPPWHEAAARRHALAETGARLHISLHGYPAHEWSRPLSGYLPRGFELWTIPKGFFLIIRHRPGLAARAHDFAERLAREVAEDGLLRAFNERQLAVWQAHAGVFTFPVHHAIPCLISENAAQVTDLTLITEYPDETIYGDAFRLAHETQMRTVLAAVSLYRAG